MKELKDMGFGATEARRREAGRVHSFRKHTCKCGRVVWGNAYYSHRKACSFYLEWKAAYDKAAAVAALSEEGTNGKQS